jgi:hypothetical protein
MEQQLEQWRWRPVVNALQACRGIQRKRPGNTVLSQG